MTTPISSGGEVRIEQSSLDDADLIGELEYRSFDATNSYLEDTTWHDSQSVESFQSDWRTFMSERPDARAFTAWIDQICVGALWVWTLGDAKHERTRHPSVLADPFDGRLAQLAIVVDPDRLRMGIGRTLMTHALGQLKSDGYAYGCLITHRGNSRARHFYEAMGWVFDGDVPEYPIEVRYWIDLGSRTEQAITPGGGTTGT